MERKIRLDEFDSNEPQPQWLNQLRVTIAMGKRYEQNGDMEKAANCYKNVLYYTPNDTITRVKLSKCHQKMLQPEQAVLHQNHAMLNDPHLFLTAENEASLYFELANFEKSLIAYNTLYKQFKTSKECQIGLIKANEVMGNSLAVKGRMRRLKTILLEIIENHQSFNDKTTPNRNRETKSNTLYQAQNKRSEEAYYLRNIIENVNYYRKQLNVLPKFHRNDKLIYENIQKVIQTFEEAKRALSCQDPFAMVINRRSIYKFNDHKKLKKDMIKLQVAKYVNTLVTHCLNGRIIYAKQQAELAMKYMETHWYKPLEIVNNLFEVLGLAICLVNQDISKWTEELNDKRILFILGSIVEKDSAYNNLFYESYFGPHNHNIGNTLKKLSKQLQENDLSTYTVYLQYECIKCYLELKEFKKSRLLSAQMFTDARDIDSITWQLNALMMTAISESRLHNALKCMKVLERMIPLSNILGNENVTQFLRKILNFIAEDKVRVHKVSLKEKRKADLVDIMPDFEATLHIRDILNGMDKSLKDNQMSLLLGEHPEIDCTAFRPRAWR